MVEFTKYVKSSKLGQDNNVALVFIRYGQNKIYPRISI